MKYQQQRRHKAEGQLDFFFQNENWIGGSKGHGRSVINLPQKEPNKKRESVNSTNLNC